MLQVQTAVAAAQLATVPCYMQSVGPQPGGHLQTAAPDWASTVVPGNQQQQVQALSLWLCGRALGMQAATLSLFIAMLPWQRHQSCPVTIRPGTDCRSGLMPAAACDMNFGPTASPSPVPIQPALARSIKKIRPVTALLLAELLGPGAQVSAMLQMQSSEVQQALQLQMQAAAAGWPAGSPYLPPGTMWPFHMYSTPAWAAAQAAALSQYDPQTQCPAPQCPFLHQSLCCWALSSPACCGAGSKTMWLHAERCGRSRLPGCTDRSYCHFAGLRQQAGPCRVLPPRLAWLQ